MADQHTPGPPKNDPQSPSRAYCTIRVSATLSNAPSAIVFDATAGALVCPGGLTATVEGHDRIGGFEAFEGISVKNP